MKHVPPDQRADYTVKEVCYYMSVSREWIRNRLGTDEVPPFIRRGRRVFFPRALFEEWQQSQTVFSPNHHQQKQGAVSV